MDTMGSVCPGSFVTLINFLSLLSGLARLSLFPKKKKNLLKSAEIGSAQQPLLGKNSPVCAIIVLISRTF